MPILYELPFPEGLDYAIHMVPFEWLQFVLLYGQHPTIGAINHLHLQKLQGTVPNASSSIEI